MRSLKFLSSLAALLSAVRADAGSDHGEVIELTAKNFDSIVNPAPLILVEFMAPWCGHCKAFMPEYVKAASILKTEGIPVGKVDCTGTEETELCAAHGIQGYPTIKVFSNGVASDYKGARKADAVVSYMKKRALPALSTLTAANHSDFIKSDNVVVVAYLDPSDTESLTTFTRYAESKRDDYLFGVCHDTSSISEVSSLPKGSLVLWKKFDDGRNDFHGEKLTDENIATFVSANSLPLIDELTPSNFGTYAESGINLAYLFIEANNPTRESLVESLKPLAKEVKGKLNLVWVDATKFATYGKSLNLPCTNWPEFVIQNMGNQNKYVFDPKKEVNHHNLAEFTKDFLADKLQKSVRSQPIPTKQGQGAYVLVTEAFDDVVYGKNNQKDVFLEIYAPWCGHCKLLKHPWDNLAESFRDSKDKVLIAKLDGTENDIPESSGISVSGYPTLKFKPAGSKEFIDYEGARTLEEMIEFVEKNSANKVKAVKVELPSVEDGEGSDQIVFDDNESDPVPEDDEDKDAEHDEL